MVWQINSRPLWRLFRERYLHVFRSISSDATLPPRETMETDVLIVGAGPAGLAAAIKLRRLSQQADREISVMVLEKGSEVGSHVLSGAVIEPRALDELIPDWKSQTEDPAPLSTPATDDCMYWLVNEQQSMRLPKISSLRNHGNYIGSLSELTRWLGRKAEELGVSIFPGFAGREPLYDDKGEGIIGVATNDVGVDRLGRRKDNFSRGMAIKARITLIAEGCHGSLSKELMKKFDLRRNSQPQTYGLGIKEVWQIPKEKHQPGLVVHSVGWPLDRSTYGGSFLYHYGDELVTVGLIVGLDYKNPYLNPYQEFQQLKRHPLIRKHLEGGQCLAYGARALNEGGIQSIPQLAFPGGALIGCSAGFVNVAKIKGSHTAMKSGMLAAESAFQSLISNQTSTKPLLLEDYESKLKGSWIWQELWKARNLRPAFHKFGLYGGLLFSGIDQILLQGHAPFTLHHGKPDYATLLPATSYKPITYPKADGKLTFDLMESVARTGTNHEEDQPVHLQLIQKDVQVAINLPRYAGPEQRFCPAGVYEYVVEDKTEERRFQINAQNCIHCKTCDIKDPSQNINWVPPEGGGGPKYTMT